MNVLIVDDSAVMRKILERSLRQTRLAVGTVIEAGDGLEALQKLNSDSAVHVIFADVDMPNMDGVALLKELKNSEKCKQVPVVMVAAEGAEPKVIEALQLGAAGYIRKPFTPMQMQEALAKLYLSNSSI